MSAHTNPKTLIISILNGNISVVDDSSGAVAGVVAGTWYNKQLLGDNAWLVTVGPTILSTIDPNDIGVNSWWVNNIVVINIWIPILENVDYSAERMRFSLKEEVKNLLQAELVDTVADVKYLRITDWKDIDDRENDMLRVECTVEVEWQE